VASTEFILHHLITPSYITPSYITNLTYSTEFTLHHLIITPYYYTNLTYSTNLTFTCLIFSWLVIFLLFSELLPQGPLLYGRIVGRGFSHFLELWE